MVYMCSTKITVNTIYKIYGCLKKKLDCYQGLLKLSGLNNDD